MDFRRALLLNPYASSRDVGQERFFLKMGTRRPFGVTPVLDQICEPRSPKRGNGRFATSRRATHAALLSEKQVAGRRVQPEEGKAGQ
jgi:hypothetical protein